MATRVFKHLWHIENVTHGNLGGNEAGEYLTVTSTGDIMIYTDSDTTPGFGFLKITKNAWKQPLDLWNKDP